MKIKKSFKYRIYPNNAQREALSYQFGGARFIYNWALARRRDYYKENGKGLSCYDVIKEITKLKQQEGFEWLKEVCAQSLQQKVIDLDRAFKNFFEKRAGYPKFKKKKDKQSIRYPQGFRIKDDKIYLPKVGWVKTIFHRLLEGKAKNVTVSRTKSGRYFASFQCEVEIDEPVYLGKEIGIDLGLISFIADSNGNTIETPRFLRKGERKLAKLQRRLSKRKKGSNGRRKARLLVARQHEKVSNQRKDFLHKLSRDLVDRHRLIAFENLNIKGMVRNSKLAKSISDAGWATFVSYCEYKGIWYGCHIEKVDTFFPSTKLCSDCGEKCQTLTLATREWVCTNCGTIHSRDTNAAKNILKEAKKNTVGTTGINAGGENLRPKANTVLAVSLKPEATVL